MQQKLLRSKEVIIIAQECQASFARSCADQAGLKLIVLEQRQFASGEFELDLTLLDGLSGVHALVVHATAPRVHASLAWFFFVLDALKNRGITVSLFMPYMAYARQEQALCTIGQIVHALGAQSLTCIELHNPSVASNILLPTSNILLHDWIAKFLREHYPLDQLTLIAPDQGACARVQAVAAQLHVPLIICTKQRDARNGIAITDVAGLCTTAYAVIIDDIIDTGATLRDVASIVRAQNSACIIDALAVHGLFSADALHMLSSSALHKLYITNTIEHQQTLPSMVEIVDISAVVVKYLF